MRVATLDYTAPDAQDQFSRSLRETGFAVLVNHPIPPQLVPTISAEWLQFFGTDAKLAYRHEEGAQDGYFPADPAADGEPPRDLKEFYHVRALGRYPKEVSDAALRYFYEGTGLASELLNWIYAAAPADVTRRFSAPLSQMILGATGSLFRIQHYLPVTGSETPGSLRAIAHTDMNLLTLLPSPEEPGLQVRDSNGAWHDVPRRASSLVINVGEMLELASNGYFPATHHRVRNPVDAESGGSRLSLPLFIHPASDVILSGAVTASAFLRRRVAELRTLGWRPAPGGDRTDC